MFETLRSAIGIGILVLGLFGGGAVSWFARGAVFDWFEKPAIIREATNRANDACTIRTQAAADAAKTLTEERVRTAGERALDAYREAVARHDADQIAAQTELEQEISNHERMQVAAAEGPRCRFTDADFDSLRGNNP